VDVETYCALWNSAAFNSYKFIFHEDAAVVKHFGVLASIVQIHRVLYFSLFAALCLASIRTQLGLSVGLVHVEVPLPGGAAIYTAISTGLDCCLVGFVEFPQSPKRGFSSIPFPVPINQAACSSIPYSGSYTSAVTHSRCNKTANLRATATTARLFPFFPPREASWSPHRRNPVSAASGPRM
jgi:hypothetical protein